MEFSIENSHRIVIDIYNVRGAVDWGGELSLCVSGGEMSGYSIVLCT